uniref:NlpC/P60 family protein n=1 Tax=Thermus caliditerrae TaxID=1330700 RepID=A0A7C5RFJ0_9DEIN
MRFLVLSSFLLLTSVLAASSWEDWLWVVAQRTQGIPYRYGGSDPRTGMDCSAFVRWVYKYAGISLPRTSREQMAASRLIREYVPGALLFFSSSGRQVDHVGIYLGRGYMLHASGAHGKVVVEPVRHYTHILVAIGWPVFRR